MGHKHETPKWLKQLLEEKAKQFDQEGRLSHTDKWRDVLHDLRTAMESAFEECKGDPSSEEWKLASKRYADALKAHSKTGHGDLPSH
jgi:hypothetical protein